MKEDGRLPRSVTVTHQMGDKSHARSWALGAARTVETPFPLHGELRIQGGTDLPAPLRARLGALAHTAIAGEAAGGAPQSFADWDVRVRAAEARHGQGAALLEAMAGMQIVSTDTRCTVAGSATCEQIAAIRERARDEPVVAAFLKIIQAEQNGPVDAAVDAFASVKNPGDHPVLGAAYALALHKLSPKAREQARQRSLPTDPLELHVAAIEAYPYSPAYWSDLGDWFAGQYDYASAFYCWDVAASLPVPAVQPELTGVMLAKRQFVERIRADFPEMFAP